MCHTYECIQCSVTDVYDYQNGPIFEARRIIKDVVPASFLLPILITKNRNVLVVGSN